MIYFTLYCFAKVFDISYTGESSRLFDLFHFNNDKKDKSVDALVKVVTGKTKSNKYIDHIDISSTKAKKLIDSLLPERVQYVYKKIKRNNPEEQETSTMLYELLKYALQQDQSVQKEIYENRNTDEIKAYIRSMKNMQDIEIHSKKQTELSNTKVLTNDAVITKIVPPVIDMSKMTTDSFFSFIEKYIDDIAILQIACHAGDMWLQPSSRRYRLIKKLCDLKSEIQVIINTQTAVESIWKHMRDQDAYEMGMYKKLEEITYVWNKFEQANDSIKVKKCNYPLLHNYICCEFKSNIESIMRVGLYAYGDSISENHSHFIINSNYEQYKLLKCEFEYLWNISE